MEGTLKVLNSLEERRVIQRYAIAGAMGAMFYVEPILTFDLDVFVIPPESSGKLITLTPIYSALAELGYKAEGECINIEGVPVQFLPSYNALVEEALAEARETTYAKVPTRVVRAEHLIALCLQTGRDKDQQRVRILAEQASLDLPYLTDILRKHGLEEKWSKWKPRPK